MILQQGQVARQTGLFAPGYMDHRVERFGENKVTVDQQWDFAADYDSTQYHTYPMQMFSRKVCPLKSLLAGLLSSRLARLLSNLRVAPVARAPTGPDPAASHANPILTAHLACGNSLEADCRRPATHTKCARHFLKSRSRLLSHNRRLPTRPSPATPVRAPRFRCY